MGLDIMGCKLGKFCANPNHTATTDINEHPHFLGRLGGMVAGTYEVLDTDFFYNGPYSCYNTWRNLLAKMAGYKKTKYTENRMKLESYAAGAWKAESGPFWELIMFSDCEGCFGGTVVEKLAKDFADYDAKALTFSNNQPRDSYAASFYEDYKSIGAAFKYASGGGVVKFV